MLISQRFETALNEINEITGLGVSLFTSDGMYVAGKGAISDRDLFARHIADCIGGGEEIEGARYFRVRIEDEAEYVLVLKGEPYQEVVGRMAANQIKTVGISFAEQYDRNNFMQNVLLGNLLAIDMITKAKKLHVDDSPRVVFVIDTARNSNDLVLETVKNLSNIKSRDFVFRLDEKSVILVKSLPEGGNPEEYLNETAMQLVDNIHMEAMVKVRVGYGNPALLLSEVARSYQEAAMSLEVGRVFYAERDTISYGRLGIGRLIYQLPQSLCEMFIHEVFGEKIPEVLEDEEVMNTISRFFENSLNISETARQLYLHRNTLVYRLERIEKAVGLDIRNFEDAMTFRIAVMVLAHMKEL